MPWQAEFTNLLIKNFKTIQAKNPRYSIRSYSKKIGISPGSLSDTLKKKRTWNFTKDRALSILDLLTVSDEERNRLLVLLDETERIRTQPLKPQNFEILTDWTYYPILFSIDLPSPLNSVNSIANRLGVSEAKVRSVIEDLVDRGMIERCPKTGKLTKESLNLTAGDGPSDETIRKHHQVNLETSKRALTSLPADRRDFTSMTFAGSEKELQSLKKDIRKLHKKAAIMMNADKENTAVFRLSVQLYPMDFAQ